MVPPMKKKSTEQDKFFLIVLKKWNYYFNFVCVCVCVCVKKMVRSVNRQYLIQLVEQCYIDQENNFFFFVVIITANFVRNQKMLKKNFEKN